MQDKTKAPYRHHVFICAGGEERASACCSPEGGKELLDIFAEEIRIRGLAKEVALTLCGCLGICGRGPNVVIYPAGSWYTKVEKAEIPHIVEKHLIGDQPLENRGDPDGKTLRSEISLSRARKRKTEKNRRLMGVLPEKIQHLAKDYQKSRAFLTAVELDIFESIGTGASVEQLAPLTGSHPDGLERLLNMLVALGLLDKTNGIYTNGEIAKAYLVSEAPVDS